MSARDGALHAKRAALVVHAASRTGQEAYELARRRLEAGGLTLAETHPVQDPARMADVVRDLIDGGVDLVVMGGGDGTINCVSSLLQDPEVVLGLLPLGTANDFARTVGVPLDLGEACDTILTGEVVDVDLGMLGGRRFVNVAQVGLAVGVTRLMDDRVKKVFGSAAYPLTALVAFARHRPFSVHLEFPDGDADDVDIDDLLQVAVGSGVYYGGGNAVSPFAAIDDRALDVYAIPRGGLRRRWHVLRWFRSGRFVESEQVYHTRTRRVRVVADPPQAVSIDGELVEPEDLDSDLFEVRADALRVIAPRTSEAARLDD